MFSIIPNRKKITYKNIRVFIALELLTFLLCILAGVYLAKISVENSPVWEFIILITPVSMIVVDYFYRKITSK